MVEGTITPDITFTAADPPIGGLRTWPQRRTHHPDETPIIAEIADLHNGLRKIIKNKPYTGNNSTKTAYSHILQIQDYSEQIIESTHTRTAHTEREETR